MEWRGQERRDPKGRRPRSKRPRTRSGVLGEGQPAPSQQLGGLGSAVSSPAGSGAEPRPPKGFLALRAVRLPLQASHKVLQTVYIDVEIRRVTANLRGRRHSFPKYFNNVDSAARFILVITHLFLHNLAEGTISTLYLFGSHHSKTFRNK